MPEPHYYVDGDITPELISQLYEEAEKALKIVERVAEEVTIPTVNQLRYAGLHLSRYINDNNKEELRKVANHCQRAIYDAYETGIIYFINEINNFASDYRKTVISNILPDWVRYQEEVDKIKSFINNRSKDESDIQAKKCKENFELLRVIFNKTNYSRDELNKTIKKDRIIALGVIFAFIALILMALNFFGIDGKEALVEDIETKESISAVPPE